MSWWHLQPDDRKSVRSPSISTAPPSNVLAKLNLETDGDGNIWIKPPNFSPDANGVVGFSRAVCHQRVKTA